MIKIVFTCFTCGDSSEIVVDDIDEKRLVPVCDSCYTIFLSRQGVLVKSFTKKLKRIYSDYAIPIYTFNAAEEFDLT